MVQRKDRLLNERVSPGEIRPKRAERLASLLTLSYEPMLAWRLDGPIEFWNVGAERLYGFSPDEAIGRSSHALLQTKFPIDFAEMLHSCSMNGAGRASFTMFAKTAARLS
jgi:PAS domain S-box-containing protein